MTKKNAFTLAEVLITLAIIGVIAALTVPSVMFSTDEKQAIVGLKKAILSLNQAVDMARTEVKFQPNPKCFIDTTGGDSQSSQCEDLFNFIKDVMQVHKYCKSDPLGGGCIGKYPPAENCDGWNDIKQAFLTADGMSYFVYSENNASIMGVDINGPKAPNKWGYDVFSLQLTGTKTTMQQYEPGGCEYAMEGGKTGSQLLEESDEEESGTGSGS